MTETDESVADGVSIMTSSSGTNKAVSFFNPISWLLASTSGSSSSCGVKIEFVVDEMALVVVVVVVVSCVVVVDEVE